VTRASLVALVLVACGEPEFDRSAMLAATAHDVFNPVHTQLGADAAAVQAAATAFCADRTAANLDAVRTPWAGVKHGLKSIESWSFGPYRHLGIDIMVNVDKWPGSGTNIEAVLASDTVIDAAWAETADHADRVTGYPAMEYLLYSDGDATLARFSADAVGDRRCLLLETQAAHAGAIIADYVAEWSPTGEDYEGAFATAGAGSQAFPTEQDAITALVSGMLTATTNLAAQKLGFPMGDDAGGVVAPDRVESPYADGSVQHATWILDGVEAVYVGVPPHGLGDYVVSRQAAGDVDGLVRDRLADAKAAVAAIGTPLEVAVVDDPTTVRAAIDAVDALSASMSGELSTLLGVNPTAVEGDND